MNIRTRLTLTFFTIVVVVLTGITVSIFFFSANYRETDFYRRLRNRAINTAKVLVEVKEVNAALLRRMEKNNPASLPNQYITIYSEENEQLYSSEGVSPINVDQKELDRIRKASEIKYKFKNYEVLGFVFQNQGKTYTICAAASDTYGIDALHNLRFVLIITFLVSLVLVSILGWFYAGKVLSPISKIVDEVSKISEVNLNERLDEGKENDELSKLSRTFNGMLARLQSAFISQKTFIANASHEIKTPITVMSGEIEVTLIHPREKDYYINVLRSVLSGLKGLNTLSSQLLLLAQTSADQPDKNFSLIRIDDILWEIKEELQTIHAGCLIDVQFDLELKHESLVIEGDEQLVKVAILNLTDNACKYSDDQRVTINLHSKNPDSIAIEFINRSSGIEAENITRIFAPFFRGKNNKKVKGFGIGLSLVDKIMKLHKGTVAVESKLMEQTRFTITFPIRKTNTGSRI